jgi:hypothetical protein
MIKIPDKENLQREQRWQRALAHWDSLGFHSRVYFLSGHLQDEARKANKPLSGAEAYILARNAVESEETPFLAQINGC